MRFSTFFCFYFRPIYYFPFPVFPLYIILITKFKMNFGFPSSNYAQSQVSSSNNQFETNYGSVENGGLFSRQQCRNLARKIIQTYDGNGDGVCETIQVAKWLVDCYRAMNKSFQPTATDIASYVQVVDRNKNGKVSVEELENFIIKYFLNPNRN